MNPALSMAARNLLRSAGRRALGIQRRLTMSERDIALVARVALRERAAAAQMPHEDMGFWLIYSGVMTGVTLAMAWHRSRSSPHKSSLEKLLKTNACKEGLKEPMNMKSCKQGLIIVILFVYCLLQCGLSFTRD